MDGLIWQEERALYKYQRCAKAVKNKPSTECWECRTEHAKKNTAESEASKKSKNKSKNRKHGKNGGTLRGAKHGDAWSSVEECLLPLEGTGWMQDTDLYGWHCTDPSYWPNFD